MESGRQWRVDTCSALILLTVYWSEKDALRADIVLTPVAASSTTQTIPHWTPLNSLTICKVLLFLICSETLQGAIEDIESILSAQWYKNSNDIRGQRLSSMYIQNLNNVTR